MFEISFDDKLFVVKYEEKSVKKQITNVNEVLNKIYSF